MKTANFNKNKDGLLPAIIQDAQTLKVLMLGYMNQEAFEKTQSSGKVTFFSRSKKKIMDQRRGKWELFKISFRQGRL